jgi:kynurenine formamidase
MIYCHGMICCQDIALSEELSKLLSGEEDQALGFWGKLREAKNNAAEMQLLLGQYIAFVERVKNLLNWTHPVSQRIKVQPLAVESAATSPVKAHGGVINPVSRLKV